MTGSEMKSPAPGWYDDGHGARRWWTGRDWSEHTQPTEASEAVSSPPQTSAQAQAPSVGAAAASTRTESPKQRVGFFGAKKTAEAAIARNEDLEKLVDQHGLRSVAEKEQELARLTAAAEAAAAALTRAQAQLADAERATAAEKSALLDVRNAIEVQELGLYDFEHPAESSAQLATRLESVRGQIKDAVRTGRAVTATQNFTFNNSAAQGRKFVNDMTKIMLRAYNAEAENAVKSVKAGSLHTAQARLSKAAEMIAKQGAMVQLAITSPYHRLRLEEIELAATHLQALQREKELERARREELREQRKAEQELRAERERLEKERQHYLSTIQALISRGDAEGAARVQERLDDVDRAITDVDYRQANVRAGYVYVISNIGAFGPDMVKIGMTRRLEPMERVDELGDASVPFRFDVHALFFADDAVGIEAMLHKTFAEQRVNRINLRREFFNTTPDRVLEVLQKHRVEVVEWRTEAAASEYRASAAISSARVT